LVGLLVTLRCCTFYTLITCPVVVGCLHLLLLGYVVDLVARWLLLFWLRLVGYVTLLGLFVVLPGYTLLRCGYPFMVIVATRLPAVVTPHLFTLVTVVAFTYGFTLRCYRLPALLLVLVVTLCRLLVVVVTLRLPLLLLLLILVVVVTCLRLLFYVCTHVVVYLL